MALAVNAFDASSPALCSDRIATPSSSSAQAMQK